jgi:S-methylmethionine-dependent homocysteine/selenocysteine methylase
MPESKLEQRLAQGDVIILDGGMGAELKGRGLEWRYRELWATNALLFEPDMVRTLHQEYIEAGARVITVNSYGAYRLKLETAGLGDRTVELNRLAVTLAQEARDNVKPDHQVWIAGSLSHLSGFGPLSSVPTFDPKAIDAADTARREYGEQAEALAEAGVDLIIAESIPGPFEARLAAEAAAGTGVPTWAAISTTSDGRARSGETMSQVAEELKGVGVSAILVFHSSVENCDTGLRELQKVFPGATGVYVESGGWERYHLGFSNVISPIDYLEHCCRWVGMGAQIIGGCCGIGPNHIEVLSANLPSRV